MEGMYHFLSHVRQWYMKLTLSFQYLFIIYGSVTLAFGLIVVLVLPDSPSKAWFFTAEEKNFVALRLAENETSINSDRVCLPPPVNVCRGKLTV